MSESIFKAYDIRGIYPSEINEDIVYRIGRAFVVFLGAENICIGRDARESSPALFEALVRGVTDQGANVIDIGTVSTPVVYHASGSLDVDGAISLTASHNPAQYNGLKLMHREAVPIGIDSGLQKIQELVEKNTFTDSANKGLVSHHDAIHEYVNYFSSFAKLGQKKLRMVVDYANGMGITERLLFEKLSKNVEIIPLFDELDMSFPNHEANPLKTDTLMDLRRKVMEEKADLGVAFDGDADRVGFVDEKGSIVPMDYITALIALAILEKKPGSKILYDLRSTKAVKELVEAHGGVAHECRVGHAYIKRQMREENAIFAGELSGHYYFAENFIAESASLAIVFVLNMLAKNKKTLSTLVTNVQKYYQSGEINSEVDDKKAIMDILKKTYKDGTLSELDGIKVVYPNWWFSVRSSNTEPYLRLNIEADSKEMLEIKKAELLTIIE